MEQYDLIRINPVHNLSINVFKAHNIDFNTGVLMMKLPISHVYHYQYKFTIEEGLVAIQVCLDMEKNQT